KLVRAYAEADLIKAVSIVEKAERYAKIDEIKENTLEHFAQTTFWKEVEGVKVLDEKEQTKFLKQVGRVVDEIVRLEVRRLITVDKVRPDGRIVDEFRHLYSRVAIYL